MTSLPTHPMGASVRVGARIHGERGGAGSRGGKEECVLCTGLSERGRVRLAVPLQAVWSPWSVTFSLSSEQ